MPLRTQIQWSCEMTSVSLCPGGKHTTTETDRGNNPCTNHLTQPSDKPHDLTVLVNNSSGRWGGSGHRRHVFFLPTVAPNGQNFCFSHSRAAWSGCMAATTPLIIHSPRSHLVNELFFCMQTSVDCCYQY
jgi:hypothetical protein